MKKFIKSIIILGLFLIPCFSNAVNVYNIDTTSYTFEQTFSSTTATNFYNHTNKNILVCFNGSTNGITVAYKMVDATISRPQEAFFCIRMNDDYNGNYLRIDVNAGKTLKISVSELINPSECPVMSSLQCQTNYNLIPISDVTANYCKLNFNLIDPSECPSGGGGSGESVVFSNVYVNNVLYPGGADIYLDINERLATEISYNSELMYIDIDFDGDEDYINGIIDINSYKPTSEDFTNIFVGGLVRLFPFIVIALFIAFVRKLIRKIFK